MGALATPPRRASERRKKGWVDFPFVKSTKDSSSGTLELRGYASTWIQDRDGEFVDPHAFDDSIDNYLSKNPIILLQHNPDWPFGNVSDYELDDTGLAVVGDVPKPSAGEDPAVITGYNKTKAGVLRTFSIGGWFERDVRDRELIIVKVELFEISVVSVPANPDSIFEAASKAFENGGPRAEISPRAIEQMKQLLGIANLRDPDLIGMSDEQRAERYEDLCTLYEKAGKQAPPYEAWREMQTGSVLEQVKALSGLDTLLKTVEGNVRLKRGRVLSKANEDKLRDAMSAMQTCHDKLSEVLDQLESETGGTDGGDDGEDQNAATGTPAAVIAARLAAAGESEKDLAKCSACGHQQAAYKDNCDECGKPMKGAS